MNTKQVFVTTSWDDGHVLDIKLARLLAQYGVQGTFYVAPHDHELAQEKRLTEEQIRTLAEHFEIGAHTLTHHHLPTLSDEEAEREIVGSKKELERVLGAPVVSFCYPAGYYDNKHVTMVQNAGFVLARTVRRFSYTAGDMPFEMPTSVHTYDHWLDIWGVLTLARFNPFTFFSLYRHWDRQAMRMFDHVRKQGGVFHLWGHSWEVAQHGDWERLERVVQYISGHADVQYVQNKDLVAV